MSNRHYGMHAANTNAMVTDIHHMDSEEVKELYGIQIDPSGSVFDPTYNRDFISLGEWADWCVSNDEIEEEAIIDTRQYGVLT